MAKKPRFTKEQHEKIGQELVIIRNRIIQISVEISGAYPVSTGITGLATTANKYIDELRNRLDSCVFEENRAIATIDFAKIYYCNGTEKVPDFKFSESDLVVLDSSRPINTTNSK